MEDAAPDDTRDPPVATSVPASAAVDPSVTPPSDDPLTPAVRAVDRGDLRAARRLATALAQSPDAELATRARALLDQLAVDPVIVAVMAATGALIVALAIAFIFAR